MDVELIIPDSVAQAIRLPEERISQELLVELAIALYRRGILSFGKARELAMEKHE
jgi:predicted HTH domain antitoxin